MVIIELLVILSLSLYEYPLIIAQARLCSIVELVVGCICPRRTELFSQKKGKEKKEKRIIIYKPKALIIN